MTVLLKWGRAPLVRNGRVDIALALERPSDFSVWELETNGRRLRKIPSAVRDGHLAFTASVEGPDGARLLYEIAAD